MLLMLVISTKCSLSIFTISQVYEILDAIFILVTLKDSYSCAGLQENLGEAKTLQITSSAKSYEDTILRFYQSEEGCPVTVDTLFIVFIFHDLSSVFFSSQPQKENLLQAIPPIVSFLNIRE